MASTERQIVQLLDLILARTKSGEMRWHRSAEPDKYQSRIGDFVVNLGPSSPIVIGVGRNLSLVITRLDGTPVEVISDSQNVFSNYGVRTPVIRGNSLKEIYDLVIGGNNELDDLIKLLSSGPRSSKGAP